MDISNGNFRAIGGSNNLMVTRKERREAARAKSRKRADKASAKRKADIKSGKFVRSVDKDTTATARQIGRELPKETIPTKPKEEIKREEKPTIDLTPEVGRQPSGEILLNQPQAPPTTAEKALGVTLAVGAGVGIGAGLFFGGAAIAGKIAAARASAIVGKAVVQKGAGQVFGTASHFATNTKSLGLTKSLLLKAGLSIRALVAIGGALTTYPFALFEIAEASDKIGIAMFRAATVGDEEEVLRLVEIQNEMLDLSVWEKIILLIPIANVAKGVLDNINAALVSADSFRKQALEEIRKSESGEESEFQKSRRESDEAAFERKREFGEEETKRFEDIDKERQEAKERETRILQEVFRLRRAGKFDEADELELTIFE